MLQILERRGVTLAVKRNHKAHYHACQRRMDARLEHRNPEHQTNQHVKADPVLTTAIHPKQSEGCQNTDGQRLKRQLLV